MVLNAKDTIVARDIPFTRVAVLKISAGMIQDMVPEALIGREEMAVINTKNENSPKTEIKKPKCLQR
jgi:hypothetical protein